ncbi:MAG: alkaline-phosphatase-like protein [Monoraphidium minutum]|nr:MAG: alkaline-phosphatase-like protein [Monoraphidium minutum]
MNRSASRAALPVALLLAALLFAGGALAAVPSSAAQSPPPKAAAKGAAKPNIIFILVDDHDPRLNTTAYMPLLNKHIIDKGVTFDNWFVNTPVCCPSRATILTGRHAHNTNFTDLFPPYGGHTRFKELHLDREYLPTWLADQGYATYFTGKYVIEYAVYNYQDPPKGWTDFDAVLFPYTFNFTHPVFSRNGGRPAAYPGAYSTDVVRDKALAQIRAAAGGGRPFYAQIAPASPHDSVAWSGPMDLTRPVTLLDVASARTEPPVWAPRHDGMFEDVDLPYELIGSFNESDVRDKPWWLRGFRALTAADVDTMRSYYRARLRTIQSVDDLVGSVVDTLEELGIADNTYIFYTSDNGYHIGAHRQGSGKESPFEEDVRVPFFVRGPGLKAGAITHDLGTHVDLAATFVTLAGGRPPALTDGQPAPLQPVAKPGHSFFVPEHAYDFTPVEFWGWYVNQLAASFRRATLNFVYKSVRAQSLATRGPKRYTTWCNGEREMYDLTSDPFELDNLYRTSPELVALSEGRAAGEAVLKLGVPPEAARGAAVDAAFLKRVGDRLDGLISGWHDCKGASECVTPLARFRPSVTSLTAAMDPSHDAFFAGLPRFKWGTCMMHAEPENEMGAFDRPATAKPPAKRNLAERPASGPGGGKACAPSAPAPAPGAPGVRRALVESNAVEATDAELTAWAAMGGWVRRNRMLLTAFH